ncbi:MAG: prepilin-type N-terminal cleavage/methylation domain-containing protein [Phycisphaeraceae bacterium]
MRLRHQGFTLVEMLLVVAIITVLLAMLLPMLGESKTAAQRVRCLSNLHGISNGLVNYALDHEARIPRKELMGAKSVFNWLGTAGTLASYSGRGADDRYLNPYVASKGLSHNAPMPMAHCPTDNGFEGADTFYKLVGVSYSSTHHPSYEDLTRVGDNIGAVSMKTIRHPDRLVAGAEHGAHNNAWSEGGFFGKTVWWHKRPDWFNVAFADGHAAYTNIPWGGLIGDRYTFHETR